MVLENLVSEKSLGFGKFGLGKKVSVSENLVSEKSLGFGFGEFGLGKRFRPWKIWPRKKNLGCCLGKEKIKITRKKLDQVNSANLIFEY